jgi:hypothetical protein
MGLVGTATAATVETVNLTSPLEVQMIRTTAHRSVDFIFDVVAELFAMLADVGPHLMSMFRRARERWVARRAALAPEPAIEMATFADETGVDDLRDNLGGLDILEAAFQSQDKRDYSSV